MAAGLVFTVVRVGSLREEIVDVRKRAERESETLDEILRAQKLSLAMYADLPRVTASRLAESLPSSAVSKVHDMRTSGTAVEAKPEPPSPVLVEKTEALRALVDRGTASGHWTEENRDQMHALLLAVSDADRAALSVRLINALNERKIDFTAVGPPF